MEKKLILCDTNIFINWFAKDSKTNQLLIKTIGIDKIAIPSLVYLELCQGVDNKKELDDLQKKLKLFPIVHFDKDVSILTKKLTEKFYLSHNLSIPDAIIAATAIVYDLSLFTYNTKDFKFISELNLLDY